MRESCPLQLKQPSKINLARFKAIRNLNPQLFGEKLMERRHALKLGLVASCSLTMSFNTSATDTTAKTGELIEKWMLNWMTGLNSVTGSLHVGRFADPIYYLTEEIGWTPNEGQQYLSLIHISEPTRPY